LRSQKQDKGELAIPQRHGNLLPFKAVVGSGVPAFAHARKTDLSLLSPSTSKRPVGSAAEESHCQVLGFVQATARAASMAPAAPVLGLQSQSQDQQQPRRFQWSGIASLLLP